jgi:hypothetical protein
MIIYLMVLLIILKILEIGTLRKLGESMDDLKGLLRGINMRLGNKNIIPDESNDINMEFGED